MEHINENAIFFPTYKKQIISVFRLAMLKVLCLTLIVGVALRATRADDDAADTESKCIEEIKDELEGYIRSETWQELFRRHYKFIVDENGKILSERKRLKFNTIVHNVRLVIDSINIFLRYLTILS